MMNNWIRGHGEGEGAMRTCALNKWVLGDTLSVQLGCTEEKLLQGVIVI